MKRFPYERFLMLDSILDHIKKQLTCYEDSNNFLQSRRFLFEFAVIWNILEKKKMRNHASIEKVSRFVEKMQNIENINITEIFEYFKKRYTNNTDYLNLFKALRWIDKEKDKKDETYRILTLENPIDKDKIKAILYIIFRLRNNLFHGEKSILTIDQQRETFNLVNSFLLDILETPNRN